MGTAAGNFVINRRPRFKTSQLGYRPGTPEGRKELIPTYEDHCKPEIRNYSQGLIYANENIMFDFVKMVEKGEVPKADLTAALKVQGLAEAIEMGGKSRKEVLLDELGIPVKNQ